MSMRRGSLLWLPQDVVIKIMDKLSLGDALMLGTTCRALHSVLNKDDAWMERCRPWNGEAFFESWRQLISLKALFRLSRSLSNLTSTWTCQDLSPRGGLLYITWGTLSILGWKVIPETVGRVSFTPLFEIICLSDGSTKLELISTTTNCRLPATLKLFPPKREEFQLEVFGRDVMVESLLANNGLGDLEVGNEFSLSLQQNILLRGFPLGPDNQLSPLPDRVSRNIGQSLFQYLKRLATFRNVQASIPAELEGVRYSYQKLDLPWEPEHTHAGLWSGVYGPHGLEVLAVYYEGDHIIGRKVIGDPDVPCGVISFEVRIATETNEVPKFIQRIVEMANLPGESKVVSMFSGKGRLADYNFHNPRWVNGRLLVHEGGNISFIWEPIKLIAWFAKLDLLAQFMSEGAHQVVLPPRL